MKSDNSQMRSVPAQPVVVIAGASGLVGSCMLKSAQARGWRTIALLRKGRENPGADETFTVNFDNLSALSGLIGARKPSAFLCALGSAIRKAGSREIFARIDRDYVEAFAILGKRLGTEHFGLVSAVGADAASRAFYLRIKGEAEDRVKAQGFKRLDIARPGLILGPRPERRPVERLAQQITRLAAPLLAGSLKKYRAIPAQTIADALVAGTMQDHPGTFVHDYQAMHDLAKQI